MMDTTGRITGIGRDYSTDKIILNLRIDTLPSDLDELKDCDALDITVQRHRNKRSLNANALLWECIGRIAAEIHADKWEIYLQMLKRYGEYTYVCIKPKGVEMLKQQWRECEELGEIDINGQKAVQMLCYYGSHTYNTKQFSRLLDGVISEMREMGIDSPTDERIKRSIEEWGK